MVVAALRARAVLAARAVFEARAVFRGRAEFEARAVLVTLVALAALPVAALADDVVVSARVDRSVVSLSDQLTLTIEIEGTMKNVPSPTLPMLDEAFSVYSAGSSTNMSWVNGQMSSSRSWTYRLVPKVAGTFTIGSAEVEFDGAVYSTEPIEIEVVEGAAPPSQRELSERDASGVEARGRDVFITTSVDKQRAYVGEQVTLSFKFYRSVELWEQPRYAAPELTGFWVVDIQDREEYYETVDGVRYRVVEIKTALFGTSAGTSTIGPASLTYRTSSAPVTFFARPGRLAEISTDRIEIEVVPLPEEGRPEDFGGAVGLYAVTTSLESESVDQWKPVTLTIRVTGTGNVSTVPDPVLPDLPEFKVYESGTSTATTTSRGIVAGRKTYEYVLVPQTAGPKSIPAMTLSFFEPNKEQYTAVTAPELALAVLPAEATDAGSDLPARAAIARLGRDIRYIHEPAEMLRVARPPLHDRLSFALIQLIPLAALGGALAVRRRRDRFASEDGLERFLRAPGRARKELRAMPRDDGVAACSSVARVVTDFVGDRLRVAARGMTMPELSRELRSAGATDELAERVVRLLSECDLGRFAGGSGAVDVERLFAEAVACLGEIERISSKRRR